MIIIKYINNHDGYFVILSLRDCLAISEVSASFSGESLRFTHDIRSPFFFSWSSLFIDNFLDRSLALDEDLCFLTI